ncbi:hypothetical protein HDZ31DRAFT_84940 [Schizophyllum fasciatum]
MVYWVDDAPPPRDGPSETAERPDATSAPYAHHYSAHSFKGMNPFAYIAIAVILIITTGVLVYMLYGCCTSAKRSEEHHQEIKKLSQPGSKSRVTRWRWAKMDSTDDSHTACLERSASSCEKYLSSPTMDAEYNASPLAHATSPLLSRLQLPPRMFDVHVSPRTSSNYKASAAPGSAVYSPVWRNSKLSPVVCPVPLQSR